MTKVQYLTACTLDGFIADRDNSLDWLYEVPHGEDDGYWDGFIGAVGPLVMGATTYTWMLDTYGMAGNPQPWRDFYGDRPAWVFTHRELPAIPGVALTFATGDVRAAYDEIAAAAAGRNIWLIGGGDLAGQFADAGLLHEIILGMTPVTLGAGAPLLPRRLTSSRLSFQRAEHVGQQVRMILAVH